MFPACLGMALISSVRTLEQQSDYCFTQFIKLQLNVVDDLPFPWLKV